MGIEAVATQAELITSHTVTKTVTHPVISTQFVHIIHASSLLEGQGAYSFTEDNGTTTWLGATPPATASLLFSTHIVTLHPVPLSSSPLQKGTSTVTRYLTVSSTETVTKILTETKTLSISTASAPSYTGMGSGGWNSTMATLKKTKPLVTGPGKPVLYQSGVEVKLVHHDETAYPLNPSGTLTRRIKARGIGDVVVATIGGAVVSWTNNYAGSSPSTKTEATMAPVTMTAPVIGGPSCKPRNNTNVLWVN